MSVNKPKCACGRCKFAALPKEEQERQMEEARRLGMAVSTLALHLGAPPEQSVIRGVGVAGIVYGCWWLGQEPKRE